MKKILLTLLVLVILTGCGKKEVENDDDNLDIEVYTEVKLSSLFKELNVSLEEDYTIFEKSLGEKEYIFKYKKNNELKEGKITINVVDTTKPVIMQGKSLTVEVGYKRKLESSLMSGDNYDNNPKREIIGNYNFNRIGDYELVYKVTDSSGNYETQEFTLHVKEPEYDYSDDYTDFNEIKEKYSNNKVGIDVSSWQGDIDFKKLKESGVDFVMIRVGTQTDFNEDSVLDKRFKNNIKKANEAGIKAGIYYYSYASNKEEAKKQALWVYNQIKDYQIDLPVAFDWESFSYFNDLKLSLYDFNEVAYEFLDTLKEKGYDVYLYGSRNYLVYVFNPKHDVWVAHYTDETDYTNYKMWQITNDGKVNGIYGYVDIDIMYE